jgi:hypothetical protein
MPRIQLSGGAYQARSVITSAQRSLNLIAEPMPRIQGEPAQFAYYPTPGLTTLLTLPQNVVRGIRQASSNAIYAVAGSGVYRVTPGSTWSSTHLGDITAGRTTPVSMMDNGTTLMIVDGSGSGWTVNLATDAFAQIGASADPGGMFAGADAVAYLDTFFIFNKPASPQFYWSLSNSATFDPYALDIANKETAPDNLVTLAVTKSEIWLLGARTTEIWTDIGAQDSQFQRMPGVLVDHGCAAKYSVAEYDDTLYWLMTGRASELFVGKGSGYQATRISTYAIEDRIMRYVRSDDAIGFCYSRGGHAYYVITFPTADATWAYDITTGQWHEWLWIDSNGDEHRHRANCMIGTGDAWVLTGDWQNGNIYIVDPTAFTDAGTAIKRQRSFPHLINDGKRVFYREFIADIAPGNPAETTPDPIVDLSLDWSNDRGNTFGSPVTQSIGNIGSYLRSLQYQRLGMARDRVFRLTWSVPADTALQGAWIEVEPGTS